MNEHLFYKINQKSTIRKELLEYAVSVTDWKRPLTFLATLCPKEIYLKDILFEKLNDIINPDRLSICIFKIPAKTYYNIHVDSMRTFSFNMLLNDSSKSVSFFKNSKFEHHHCGITELEYEPDCLYLFNTQMEHAVLNQGDDRYILSVRGKNMYDDALKFVKEINL